MSGVKMGTSDEIIYLEINKANIIASIKLRQKKFYQKFMDLDPRNCIAKRIWLKFQQVDYGSKKAFLEYYESLPSNPVQTDTESRKDTVRKSEKTMHKRYLELFNLDFNNVLYNSMIDDSDRAMITRWRLSSHPLYIETGRYKIPSIQKSERTCMNCHQIEDENHALFKCIAHRCIRDRSKDLLILFPTVQLLLNPRDSSNIKTIANYLREIEENMKKLKLCR